MRWLVQVSRVSDVEPTEQYCIEARRWQSALQEVRRLRGDEGPLPKLTIELLDDGYRAVDPNLKVRYLVSEAPKDMPLTAGAERIVNTQPPPPAASGPSAPPAAASSPPASGAPSEASPLVLAAQIIRQREEAATPENPIHYRELALSVKPGATRESIEALLRSRLEQMRSRMSAAEEQHYFQIAVFDHMFVKRPVRPPLGTLAWKNWRGEPVLTFPGYQAAASTAPESAPAPSSVSPSWAPPPIAGSGAPSASPPRPSTSPPAGASPSAPPPAAPLTSPPAARGSVIPARVVSVGPSSAPPRPLAEAPVVPLAPAAPPLPPPTDSDVEITVESGPISSVPISGGPVLVVVDEGPESAPSLEAAAFPAAAAAEAPAPPAVAEEPKPEAAAPAPSAPKAPDAPAEPKRAVRSDPPPSGAGSRRRSSPEIRRRRVAGEDLIGELFERMHELSFMADVVSGAEFVVDVLSELIPCEAIVVHVFDLGRREFVVVRARGPNARAALAHRTPDGEAIVRRVMAQRHALVLNGDNAPETQSATLTKIGVAPRAVLTGAARLGGRYLGLVELANPAGDTPFHDGEINALDYVCEQFAEFVASKPIVLDDDVVLG